MKISNLLYILFVFILTTSCNKIGNKTSPGGMKYYVHTVSEGRKAIKGDILQLRFGYSMENDSMLFSSDALTDSMIMEFTEMPFSQMNEAIGLMAEGDSMTFYFSPDSVYQKIFQSKTPSYFSDNALIKWHVKLMKVYTKEAFRNVIDQRVKINSKKEDNDIIMYCNANELLVKPRSSGLVFISFIEGKGSQPAIGDTLVVKYTGRFLSGQIFDSSEEGIGAIRFVLGEGKMIDGWEEGFSYMKEGGTARLIIPSRLAYGIKGFGPVSGDTPIVYDVELIKVYSKKGI